MFELIRDLRHAARSLAKRRGFTTVALVTLGLGIGSTTAIFSVVDAVLLAPLPYERPGELVGVWTQFPEDGLLQFPVSVAELLDYRQQTRALSSLAGATTGSVVLTGSGDPERLSGAGVTADLWPTLGVEPSLGRTFGAEEDRPGSEAIVLSHGLWQRRFGGDPEILGRTLVLDGEPSTVIGVMPAGFAFPAPGIELWAPLGLGDTVPEERSGHFLTGVGRLAPGATLEQLQGEMAAISGRWTERHAHAHPMTALDLREQTVGAARQPVLLLFAAVASVLLIACANVAGLLLARGEGRRGEIAVRSALGASRIQLVRLLLGESLLLAAGGGLLGLTLASFGLDLLLQLDAGNLPRLGAVSLDGRALAFAAAITALTAVACGLFPGLRAARTAPTATLRGGRGDRLGNGGGAGGQRARRALVIGEVAAAVVLVCGAGLMLRTLGELWQTEPGFDSAGAITARVELPRNRYDAAQTVAFYERLGERLRHLPGVTAASQVSAIPLRENPPVEGFERVGPSSRGELPTGEDAPAVRVQLVTPGFFATLGIPLRGRDVVASDHADSPRVAVINRTLAETYFRGEEPLGERIRILASSPQDIPFEIVGVAGDVRDDSLSADPRPTIFLAHAQAAHFIRSPGLPRTAALVLRSDLPAGTVIPALREAVWALDEGLAVYEVTTLDEVIDQAVAGPRLLASLLGVFSAVALILAAVGIYGLLAQVVGQRTYELGIRFALGASRREVLGLILRQGMALLAVGLAIGLALTVIANRSLSGALHGVGPGDTASYLMTVFVLALAALVACWLPARRAARVDPAVVLRAS